jgi:hypothetical protein
MMDDETLAAALWRLDTALTGALDQVDAAWGEIEPVVRAWVAEADTLTEQDWQDEPESTRALYDGLKRILAAYDASTGQR